MPCVWNAFRTDKVTAKLSVVEHFCRRSKHIVNREIVIENTNISKAFFTLKVLYGLFTDTSSQTVRQMDGRGLHVRFFFTS